jgi:hypothetical protein
VFRGVTGAVQVATFVLAAFLSPASAHGMEPAAGSGGPLHQVATGSGPVVVVNEFAANRFVELHNTSSSIVDIGGREVWLCGSGGVLGTVRVPFGRQFAGDGYYVIAAAGFTGGLADQTYGGVLPGGGAALLGSEGDALADGVAVIANSPCGRGDPAPACPYAATARDSFSTDTGRNAADFSCRTVSPGEPN